MLLNKPCILGQWITEGWLARRLWCNTNGDIDIDRIFQPFPRDQILCVGDCSRLEFDAHPSIEMTVDDYLTYWRDFHQGNDGRTLYLKDWHYFKATDTEYYQVPILFMSDWMNEFWRVRPDVRDDFRFVYLGTKGTWTPLHADVYHSYSWSANICGTKRWWFLPPGEETKLKYNGRVPSDIRDVQLDNGDINYIQIDQHPGQAVFVPSGWYHQVVNLTDCLSINHNWFNATNVNWVWQHLQNQLVAVETSTEDVRDTPGWREQCQICLRALAGIDYFEYALLLKYILLTRWPENDGLPSSNFQSLIEEDAGAPDQLSSLSNKIDHELIQLFRREPHHLKLIREKPKCWMELIPEMVTDCKQELPAWVRLHDFVSAFESLRLVSQNSIVKALKLVSEPLYSMLNFE
ncbi:hypothetical protein CRM22_003637 [Opisthorchis felineus]|nr:hypothetical protein CRM22_003637 [Opisthorchis felineus]